MGVWHFIQPTGTQNLIVNPSFANNLTDGWANHATGAAGGTRTRTGGDAKFGAYYLALLKNAGAQADQWGLFDTLTVTSVLNNTYVMSTWVQVGAGATAIVQLNKSAGVGILQTVQVTLVGPTTDWVRLETPVLTANATGDNLVAFVYITGTPNVTGDFDAVQVEIQSEVTTYCDGDQRGCEWLGAEHNSISERSAVSRAGGIVVDFADRNFEISGAIGPGMSPITLNVDTYAILPGGELNSQKTNPRSFSLTGWIRGTSLANLHTRRQALIDDLSPNAMPGDQPVVLRYTGATVTKEINAYYETGMEGAISARFECLEQNVALRFLATDPDFLEIGESSAILDSNDTDANRRDIAARLRATGQWDTLGPPNVAGVYNQIYAIAVAPDKTVYLGGSFTNFDNIAAADFIVAYTPSTGVWAAVGGGLGNLVRDIAIAPNGDIYVCGTFLNAGGVAAADYIAFWDGAAWNAVGVPNGGGAVINSINAMAFDSTGNLYIGGDFTTLAGIAAAIDIAMWDGAAWNAVGTPGAGAAILVTVDAVAIDSVDNVYVGGNFTTLANITGADYIGRWDGTAWNLVVQLNGIVQDLVTDNQDQVFLTGAFTNAGGDANADRIARWNSQVMNALSTGLNGQGEDLSIAPDGLLYAAGSFTTAGGLTVPGLAKWNGASWAHLDMTSTGGNTFTVEASPFTDPVVATNYDLWVGWTASGTLNYAGLTTVTNEGTEEAYPRFRITRVGGTTAILYSIRNETTGKELLFAYSLLDGETLTIDLNPIAKSIVSNFWGQRQDAILPNSDFGEWALRPGTNEVTCFVDISGAPTVTVEAIWRDPYWSAD